MPTQSSGQTTGTPEPESSDDLFARFQKKPAPETLRQLVNSMGPTIDSALRAYTGSSESPIIRQRAKIIAAQAIKTYSPQSGANLRTHVYNQLQRMQRMAPVIAEPLAPPEKFRRQQTMVYRATETFKNEYGRDPTDEEVSELSGMRLKDVLRVRGRMRPRIPMSVYEESGDDDSDSPEVVASKADPFSVWQDAVYHDLGNVDKLVMQYRTGYRGAPQLDTNEIARRLNISPAAVSQRAKRIQMKLDSYNG
jgi:DNA-directed RNA polymerase specialized sigma subunit